MKQSYRFITVYNSANQIFLYIVDITGCSLDACKAFTSKEARTEWLLDKLARPTNRGCVEDENKDLAWNCIDDYVLADEITVRNGQVIAVH